MLSAAELTMAVLREFHLRELPCLYLRNYEELPLRIGNDVDLLVASGYRDKALSILKMTIQSTGWSLYQAIEFGPLSLYLYNEDRGEFLHIDLFDRIEWHWIPFARPADIIKRRIWNGLVFHPDTRDEVFLNVMTRLGYAGIVREKHRIQANKLAAEFGENSIVETWIHHLGKSSGAICGWFVARDDWEALIKYFHTHRTRLFSTMIIKQPLDAALGLIRYGKRSINRMLHPPGPVIAWIGKDADQWEEVGPALERLLMRITGREDVRVIRLKHISGAKSWFACWRLWLSQVIPSRIKNRAVILIQEPSDRISKKDWRFGLNPVRGIASLLRYAVPSADLTLGSKEIDTAVSSHKTNGQGYETELRFRNATQTAGDTLVDDINKRVISLLCGRSS